MVGEEGGRAYHLPLTGEPPDLLLCGAYIDPHRAYILRGKLCLPAKAGGGGPSLAQPPETRSLIDRLG